MAKNYYDFRTQDGIIVPDTTEILSDTQQDFQTVFGQDLSLEEATPQGRLIEQFSLAKRFIIGLCALQANQINPQYATGESLDSIGSLFNVNRKTATATTVWVSMVINKATTLPKGIDISDKNGNTFYLVNETEIPTSGTYLLQFECSETGEVIVNVGDIDAPSKTLIALGVESASNNSSGITGFEAESDVDYSKRIEQERFTGKSLIGDIKAAIDEIDSVVSSVVYNNGESTAKPAYTGSSVNVDAHSILAVVFGGNDDKIARALIDNISAGCGYTAISGQSKTITVGYGKDNSSAYSNITFNRPNPVEVFANITVEIGNYTGSDLPNDITSYLVDWSMGANTTVSTVEIGQNVSPFSLANAIQQIFGCYVANITIGTSKTSLGYNEILIEANQIPRFSKENISIIVATK